MTNQVITFPNANLPSLANLPSDLLAKVAGQWKRAAELATSAPNRLTFKSSRFNLSDGGSEPVVLDDRVLDVYLVAVNPQFHYVFYDMDYDTAEKMGKTPKTLSRYPIEGENWDSPPPAGFVQRNYRQRAVIMLANDPTHKLYVVDFGYKSVKQSGNAQSNTCNLSTLLKSLHGFFSQNQGLMPFMMTVQLSFDTKHSVPVVAFSLYDNRNHSTDIRFANDAAIAEMIRVLSNGDVERLLDIHFDNSKDEAVVNAAPPATPQTHVPPQGTVQPPQGTNPPWQGQAQGQAQPQTQSQGTTPLWQGQAQPQTQPQYDPGMAAL